MAAAAEWRAAAGPRDHGRDLADCARAARRRLHTGGRSARRMRRARALTGAAERVAAALEARGASFFVEIVQASGLLRVQVEDALGELVARGLVTADSFHGLRAVLTPQSRRRGFRRRGRLRGTAAFDAAGRWALLGRPSDAGAGRTELSSTPRWRSCAATASFVASARARGARAVVARAVADLSQGRGAWRDPRRPLRGAARRRAVRAHRGCRGAAARAAHAGRGRMARAVDRGPVESRELRRRLVARSRAEPPLVFRNGAVVAAEGGAGIDWRAELSPADQRRVAELLGGPRAPRRERPTARAAYGERSPGLSLDAFLCVFGFRSHAKARSRADPHGMPVDVPREIHDRSERPEGAERA